MFHRYAKLRIHARGGPRVLFELALTSVVAGSERASSVPTHIRCCPAVCTPPTAVGTLGDSNSEPAD